MWGNLIVLNLHPAFKKHLNDPSNCLWPEGYKMSVSKKNKYCISFNELQNWCSLVLDLFFRSSITLIVTLPTKTRSSFGPKSEEYEGILAELADVCL